MVNLFGYRATKPTAMPDVDDPVGQHNVDYLRAALEKADYFMLAWGGNVRKLSLSPVLDLQMDFGAKYQCLELTAKGQPRHPLYIAVSIEPKAVTILSVGGQFYCELEDHGLLLVCNPVVYPLSLAPTPELKSLKQAVTEFLTAEEWTYTGLAGGIRLSLRTQHGDLNGHTYIHEEDRLFAFYSKFPVRVPEDKRPAIAELLSRINYRTVIGTFEMGFEKRDVYVRTSIDVEGDPLTHALLRRLIYGNFYLMDEYIPVIVQVIYGDQSPLEALERKGS